MFRYYFTINRRGTIISFGSNSIYPDTYHKKTGTYCVAFKYVTYFRLQCLKRDNVRTHVENYGINQSVPKICLLT